MRSDFDGAIFPLTIFIIFVFAGVFYWNRENIRKALIEWITPTVIAFLCTVFGGIFIAWGVLLEHFEPWGKIISGVGEALVVAGIFGVYFEWRGKKELIEQAVKKAVGQDRALRAGMADFAEEADKVNYGSALASSELLFVSSRYSAKFIDAHWTAIKKRLRAGKLITHVISPRDEAESAAENFWRGKLKGSDASLLKLVSLVRTDRYLPYNWVQSDEGIWIKLYFHKRDDGPPPALYMEKDSALYGKYKEDIQTCIDDSQRIDW
jgi:hypothetical protein